MSLPAPPEQRAGLLRALEDKRVSFGANLHESCRRALSCVPLAVVQISSGYLRGPVGTGAWEPERESLHALEAAVAKLLHLCLTSGPRVFCQHQANVLACR